MKRAILGVFLTLIAGTVMGCATSGQLAKVEEQQNQIAAKADQAMRQAQCAQVTANAANRQAEMASQQANAANAAAMRAENTANAATTNNSATGGPIEQNPQQNPAVNESTGGQTQETPANQTPQRSDVFRKSMEK